MFRLQVLSQSKVARCLDAAQSTVYEKNSDFPFTNLFLLIV